MKFKGQKMEVREKNYIFANESREDSAFFLATRIRNN